MAHHTYVSIRCHRANGEFHLFLKGSENCLRFFISTDKAINGSYGYEDVKGDLCKSFNIDPVQFKALYLQILDIDLSKLIQHDSISIAEMRADEAFFQKTTTQKDKFEWIEKDQLASVKDRFVANHEIVFDRLLQEDDLIEDLPADLLEGIRILQKAHSRQKLIIFAGAGISIDSGIPLWNDLKKRILTVLGSNISEGTDSTVIAQYLYDARKKKEYNEKIRELLGYYEDLRFNAIHKAIVSLRPRHIITTNFDNLLEKAFPSPSPYSVIKQDQDFPYADSDRYLVKMHGDWELMNFVFREDDYLNYSRKWPLTEGFVRGVFASHVVLFVGFSFTDNNLKQILDWVKDILGNDLQPAYLFFPDKKNEHEQLYFKNKGLHLLSWPENYKEFLKKIGQGLTKAVSSPGEDVANFLNFLNSNKLLEHERASKAKNQFILEQMHDALHAFHAFKSLPPSFLERLFPFSPFRLNANQKQADADYYMGRLFINNEAIIQLMQSINIENNRIEVKKDGPISKEIVKVKDFESKLWYVFEKLHSSDIACIHRDGSEEHNPIGIKSPFSEHLLYAKWSEFQFDKALEAIEKREYAFGQQDWIPNPLRDGLLDGYVLSQMNFHSLAYDVFLKVENEASQAGDSALYFLSRRNRKKTMREIYWRRFSANYSETFTKQVKDEADSIDLNETLRTIKVEAPVRQLLQDIQENNVLERFTSEIEKNSLNIIDTFKLFQNPHSSHSGPDYAKQLESLFKNLCIFYDTNALIVSDYTVFEKAAEQTFEGLIASYQTSSRYENRYKTFDSMALTYCARWAGPKAINLILKKYALKEIPFAEGHKNAFVTRCINFFKSSYEVNFFGKASENSAFQRYIKNNALFNIQEKRLSPNLLRLLSCVNLDDIPEIAIQLCDSVIKSQQSLLINLANLDEFILFCEKHLRFFNSDQIDNLIDLMGDAYSFHAWYLQKFAIRLKEVQPSYRFSNRNIFQNLLPVITGENEQDRLLALVKFYDFLDEPFQNQLVEAIRENLKISVGLDALHLYFDARFAGCIPQEAFPEKVREAIKRFFGKISQIRFTSSGEIEPFNTVSQFSGEPLPHNYALIVTQIGRMHAIGGIDKKDLAWLRSQSDLPTCIRWLLAPKSFDYSQFDHYWLFFLGRADVTLKNLQSQNISELREAIQKGLHERFSEKVSEMYFGYFYVSK